MYRARAMRHEARAAAFGAKSDTPCKMQLVAGRLGLDGQTQIRLPTDLASELEGSSYVVELPDGTTGKPNDEQARLIAALRGRISTARRWMDGGRYGMVRRDSDRLERVRMESEARVRRR